MIRQFMLTVNEDYSVNVMERPLPKRDSSGRFTSERKRTKRIMQVVCPNCGAELLIKENETKEVK